MTKFKLIRGLTTLGIVFFSVSILPPAFATKHKPTIAQIEAAKKIEEEKKKSAAISAKTLISSR